MENSKTQFYSQNGEDIILDKLFKGQKSGFFIEIGCIDGRRFSNTLTFEERGWKGLCVEAHQNYIDQLKANRPGSQVYHCAVSDADAEKTPFYANARGSLSTLDSSKEKQFRSRFGRFFSGFEVQNVSQKRLDTILGELGIKEVDILSIDVEGNETHVLKGLDLNCYRPRVMVIEADSAAEEEKIDMILLSAGYYKSIKIANNIFYLQDKKMEENIKQSRLEAILINTKHPLDFGSDEFLSFSFEFPDRLHLTREQKK